MHTRLGCLSGTGLIAALLTLLLIAGISLGGGGGALFSPGALNAQQGEAELGGVRSHAEIARCAGCHPAIWEADRLADRCLDCHMEVAAQVRDRLGMHGLLEGEARTDCRRCHTDHHGATAALTRMEAASNYPHEASGFSLAAHRQGADGRPFPCAGCHTDSLARFDPAVCTDCHAQIDPAFLQAHAALYPGECLACHDGLDTFGSNFDHQAAFFPLQGKHAGLDCAACHAGARSASDLKLTPRLCFDCHAADDPHGGDFGPDCAGCHTPDRWEGAAFDHSRSAFPLTGAHARVPCRDCHGDGPSGAVYQGTPAECAACHAEPKYHAGRLGSDCAACHTTAAWTPARYDQPHTFPLDHGEGGASSCRTCHPDRLEAYTCYGCHAHTPAGIERKHQEEGLRDFADCARCHPTGREEEKEGD